MGDSLKIAQTLNNLGILYDEQGLFSKSLERYFESLRLFENHSDDLFDQAMVLGNIGIVYKKQKAYDQVLQYYERAFDTYKTAESKFGQVVTQGNIGSVLINLGRYEESIENSREAMVGYGELGYTRYVPYMQHNIAVARDSLGMLAEAEEVFAKAIAGHHEFQNTYELANTYTALANNNLKRKKAVLARQNAKKGLEYAQEANSAEFEVNALKLLAESNARLGRYNEAFDNYKAYAAGKDSLFEEDKTRQIFELTAEYETDKKQQRIELQNTVLNEQLARIQRNQAIIVGLIVTAALLALLVWLVRNKKEKEKALIVQEGELKLREAEINAVISSQEKERSRFARDLHDGFGQLISVLRLNLNQLSGIASKDTVKRSEIFNNGERVIDEMYNELRNICFDLMPQTLVKEGLVLALKEFGSRLTHTGSVHCEVLTFVESARFREVEEISLFRITQEWVNNILKYGEANQITIQITQEANELTLTIEDNGNGFDPQAFYQGKGNGWRNIQTRLKQISGSFDLDTATGRKGSMMTVNAHVVEKEPIPTSTDEGMRDVRDSLTTP